MIFPIDDYDPETGSTGEPDYPGTVMSETDPVTQQPALVSYWRLQEPDTTFVGDTGQGQIGDTAPDETPSSNHGTYQKIALAPAPGSADAPGTLQLGAQGLLGFELSTSMAVNGGYVEVPLGNSLKQPHFTLEALVVAEWQSQDTGFYRTVIDSTGDPQTTGYAIYAGPEDPQNPSGSYVWQVWVGNGNDFVQVTQFTGTAKDSRFVKYNQITYLAVTYTGTKLTLSVFVPGIDIDSVLAWDAIVPYSPNAGPTPFLIGMGRNPPGPQPRYPFHGRIQEVAVYKEALSEARIAAHITAAFKDL